MKNILTEALVNSATNASFIFQLYKFCKVEDVVKFCKNKILDNNCDIYKQGKNWYCEIDNIKITINSYSYTIITAHLIK